MLEKIDRNDIPGPGGRGKSPARAFGEETLVAFLEGYEPGEVAEVSGWPVDEGRDAAWTPTAPCGPSTRRPTTWSATATCGPS